MLLLALLLTLASRADDVGNPNLLPFGEEEAFLGNAGIANDSSTGATFYNPGALGFVKSRKVSVYGNAYLVDHTYIRGEARLNGFEIPLDSSTFNPVPLSSVTVLGSESYTYAFSVHVPFITTYEFQMPLEEANTSLGLVGNASLSTLWIGPSVAKRVSDRFAWGLSAYAVRFSANVAIMNNVKGVFSGVNLAQSVGSSREFRTWSGLAVLGAQWQAAPDWLLGARLETQSIDLWGKGRFYETRAGVTGTTPVYSVTNEKGFDVRRRLPFQAGVGAKYTGIPRLKLLGDANVQFPIDYQTSPSRPAFSFRMISRFTVRGNLGTAWALDPTHSLLAGLMVNPSAIPHGSATGIGAFTDENFRGATLGLQLDSGSLVTALGGFFLWSTGQYIEENSNGLVESPYERQLYGVLVTASYRL